MRVQNITALFQKQSKDVFKNLPVLLLFIIYPVIAFIMTQAMKGQAETGTMFVATFATMHCVFTPIVTTAGIISEEKEKNTLRVLIMSNVTLREYLFSIGGFIMIADLLTGSTFLLVNSQTAEHALQFLLSMAVGSFISIVLGTCIGLYSKNAAAASGMAVPFGMFFAFMPMLANFNKGIEAVSKFTYGQQISYLITGKEVTVFGIVVLCINFIVLLVIAGVLFKKSISED